MNDETRAIVEGLVEELNLRWRRSEFYFSVVDNDVGGVVGIACTQNYHGKQRQCLSIYVDDTIAIHAGYEIRPSVARILIADPDCITKVHDVVARELFKAK